MIKKYAKRQSSYLKLSERQLEQISASWLMYLFMKHYNGKVEDIPNINPEWIESQKYKNFELWHLEELQKTGYVDVGLFQIRKAKKGYVLTFKQNWRSKEIITREWVCDHCKKRKRVNWASICEKCEKELKAKRKYSKFIYRGIRK